jgi:6-phospho-beta-glucosidase
VLEMLGNPEIQLTMKNIAPLAWNRRFLKSLGVVPCPYHRYYYKTKTILEEELEAFKSGKTRAEVVKKLEEGLFDLYKDETLDIKPPQLEQRGGAYYSDAACNVISSIYNDKKDIQVLNVQNKGSLTDIDYDSAVEVVVSSKNGPFLIMGKLPIQVKA